MTALSPELFALLGGGTKLALLSSFAFFANVIFLLPAGVIVDRFSIRRVMLGALSIAVIGTLLFAFSPSFFVAGVGRFLTGIMIAFGLIASLKLASIYLPAEKMAFASSLIITIGMLGGIIGQAPMSWLVSGLGWRSALTVVAALGVLIGVILAMAIRKEQQKTLQESHHPLKGLYGAFKNPKNWLAGFFICLLNLPVAVFGALFGITYLMQVYGLVSMAAASIVSCLFLGMIVGSPLFGWVSDFIRGRRLLMLIGSVLCLFFVGIFLLIPHWSVGALHVLFFLIGFTSAAQVLGYPVVTENNPPHMVGSSLSLAAIIVMGGGYGLALPFFGWLIDLGSKSYSLSVAYQRAFFVILIGIAISSVLAFFLRDKKST